jgi:hypothetical protein
MVGPILDAIWPRLPKQAQRTIKIIADESDLLLAAMAWWEYGTGLKKWAESKKVLTESTATPSRGYQDEPVSFTSNGDGSTGGPFESFTPDSVSGPLV